MFTAGAEPRRRLTPTLEFPLYSTTRWCLVAAALAGLSSSAAAQATDADGKAAIAVADSVLAALSTNDNATLSRLMLDSSVVGSSALRNGVERVTLRPFAARPGPATFTERGFGATARVQDRVAQVWMPYDLYIGTAWSHCGVDTFTLMKRDGQWRVASLVYTVEQPPACNKHPAGPPAKP